MMSAVFASRSGDDVTVFEKNDRTCKKIYITGKGRCNVTNNCNIQTVIANTPTNGRFLYSALNRFSPSDTMAFFEELYPTGQEISRRHFSGLRKMRAYI